MPDRELNRRIKQDRAALEVGLQPIVTEVVNADSILRGVVSSPLRPVFDKLIAYQIGIDRYGRLSHEEEGPRKRGGTMRYVDPVLEKYAREVSRAGGVWDQTWKGFIESTARTVTTAIRHDYELRERLGDLAKVFEMH